MTLLDPVTASAPEPPPSHMARISGVLAAAVILLLGLALLVGYGWLWRYEKVYAHDDYLRGYALGEHWNATDRKGNCANDANRLYPSTPGSPNARGVSAFRAGCSDGLAGLNPAGWLLHDRIAQMAD